MCEKNEKVLVQMTDDLTVTITMKDYEALMSKAVRFDAITESIHQSIAEGNTRYGVVDDDLVLLLTGTKAAVVEARRVENEELLKKAAEAAPEEDDGK